MPTAHWTRIQDLFLKASDLPPLERERLLDRETGEDPVVRRAVESLLLASEQTGGFLTRALSNAVSVVAPLKSPQPGDRFGPYEWKRALGEGGMGSVFLAARADGAYQKEVAIKVVRAGLDTPSARDRFRVERQILAQLEHPNVARLLEGGETEDGLPYVVMEYIDGIPIDEYCRVHKLGIAARIALFRQVCAGVGYAHRNLVVHRDLKPANILVTAAGVAKIVDFGIAKTLEGGDGFLTRAGDRALTPNYASPEQVLGKHITPASDVYSLGVVLYELLTGKVPCDLSGAIPSRVEKAICEEEAPPPSAAATQLWGRAARHLRGDLDNITGKALRKDPTLRYESVDAFSADLERYLQGFPVQAAPLSVWYRLRKFVQRNRWGVLAVLLFTAAVAAFVVTLIRERNAADRAKEKAQQATKFLADAFRAAAPERARGRVVTARDILDQGADQIEKELAGQPDVQATLMRTIGVVYARIAEFEKGLKLVDKAVETRGRAVQSAKDTVDPIDIVSDAQAAGAVRYLSGDRQGGIRKQEEALRLQEKLTPRSYDLRAPILSDLGRMHTLERNLDKAENALLLAVEARRKVGDDARLAETYGRLADLYGMQAKYDKAIPMQLEAQRVLVRKYGEFHPDVVSSYNSLTRLYNETGNSAEAVNCGEKAIARVRKIYAPSHPENATHQSMLGNAYIAAGRLEDALRVNTEALQIWRNTASRQEMVPVGLNNLGRVYREMGRHEDSYRLTKEAFDVASQQGKVRYVIRSAWATALRQRGQLAEALPAMRQSLADALLSNPPTHPNIANLRVNLSLVLIDLQQYAEAETLLREAGTAHRKSLPAGHWIPAFDDALLAECRLAQGDSSGARKLAASALAVLDKANHPHASTALLTLGRVSLFEKDPAGAIAVLQRALELERKPSAFHDSFTLAVTQAWLAHALQQSGRAPEAEVHMRAARMQLTANPQHPRLQTAVSGQSK